MTRPLVKGDRVWARYDHARRGVVIAAGPEQTEVRIDGDRRQTLIFINEDLARIMPRVSFKKAGK